MSSPSFGAMSPFMDSVRTLGQKLRHPLDSLGITSMMHQDPPQQSAHDQAIQQVNADMNAHKNDAANASFVHPQKIEEQKRPLKTK